MGGGRPSHATISVSDQDGGLLMTPQPLRIVIAEDAAIMRDGLTQTPTRPDRTRVGGEGGDRLRDPPRAEDTKHVGDGNA
jgi:hypothetical protein